MGFPPAGPRRAPEASPRPRFQSTSQPAGRFQQHASHAQGNSALPRQRPSQLPVDTRIPHPPPDLIPDQVSRFNKVSDLTSKNLTEQQYRDLLSSYTIIRLEKIEPYNGGNTTGEVVKSSWERCTRADLPNMDNEKARHAIQRLNEKDKEYKKGKGTTLLEKQKSLGKSAQDQVKEMERDLSAIEDDPQHFHTVLEQIDWKEKLVVEKDEKPSSSRKHATTKKKSHKKERYERVSIHLYFKRCPRPGQVASELYRQVYQQEERLERQAPDWALEERAYEMGIHKWRVQEEQIRLERIRQERLLERERSRNQDQTQQRSAQHGPQTQPPGQQMPPGQHVQLPQRQMPPGQQTQLPQRQMPPGPQMPPGQQRPLGQQMPTQGGPPMNQQAAAQMSQQQPPTQQMPPGQQRPPTQQVPAQGGPPMNQQAAGSLPQQRPLVQQMPPSQQMQPGQQRPPLQPMPPQGGPPVNQQAAGQMPQQQRPPTVCQPNIGQPQGHQQQGQPNVVQSQPHQGQQMHPPNVGQVPPPGVPGMRLPNNGQMPPQGIPGMRVPNNVQMPAQTSGANGNGANAHRSKTPIRVVYEHGKRSKHRKGHQRHCSVSQSRGGSSDSSTRHEQWSDWGSDTEYSSMTSASGSPRLTKAYHVKYHHGSSHKKARVPRYVEEPANFGVERGRRPKRQHKMEERPDPLYFMTGSDTRVKVPSAAPRAARMAESIPVQNLAEIRAYRAGCEDGKLAAEADAPYLKAPRYRAASPRYETMPRTEFHQEYEQDSYGLPGVRRVTTSEIGRQMNLEDLARMRTRPRYEDERDAMFRHDQARKTALAREELEEIMRGDLRTHLPQPYVSTAQGRAGGQFGVDLGRGTNYRW